MLSSVLTISNPHLTIIKVTPRATRTINHSQLEVRAPKPRHRETQRKTEKEREKQRHTVTVRFNFEK